MLKATYTNYSNKTLTLQNPSCLDHSLWSVKFVKENIIYNYNIDERYLISVLHSEVKIKKGKSHTFFIPVNIKRMESNEGKKCDFGEYEVQLSTTAIKPKSSLLILSNKAKIRII